MSDYADRSAALCDILLGAAYADTHFHHREKAFVRAHLVALCGGELPRELAERIEAFDPEMFTLEPAAAAFAADSWQTRRDLLELVASLNDTDGVLDLSEDDYLRRLAGALGAEDALSGLALEYQSAPRTHSFENLRAFLPPPPPR